MPTWPCADDNQGPYRPTMAKSCGKILLQSLSLVERLNLLLITRAQRRADKGWLYLPFPMHNPVPDDMP